MSWLYSRALVAAYWEVICSDGEPSAPLNTNPMPPLFLPNDKMTDFSRLSRYGMTCEPLTDDLGAAVLTWFLAGFPAKTSAPPDAAKASPENAADSGWKWRESSVKYDPAMRLWKTRQCSLFEDSEWFSETWPRWGLMRDGECWELPMSERPTFERGSGLWQTPVANDAVERTKGLMNSRGEPKLSAQVKMWPTPHGLSKDGKSNGPSGNELWRAVNLVERPMWPTPVTEGLNGGAGARSMMDEKTRKELTGGSLNPTWVEWLMGWPLGWTDLEPLGTGKYRNALP